MWYFFAVLLLIITLLVILIMTELKLTIQLTRHQNGHCLRMKVTAWYGLIQIKKEWQLIQLLSNKVPVVTYQTETENHDQPINKKREKISLPTLIHMHKQFKMTIGQIKGFRHIIKRFAKRVTLDRWEWRSSLGTGYADETGVLSGLVWAVKAAITGLLQSYLRMGAQPQLAVHPFFNEKKMETDLTCMIRFRIGYAILAGIRILVNTRKRRDSIWKSIPFKA
jgi:hypothetical protein